MGIDRMGRAGARLLAGLALALASQGAGAKELVSPVGMFVEGGLARDARSLVVGAAWTWLQPSKWDGGRWSGYLETSVGEWACHQHPGRRYEGCSTQVGITPVIRFSGLAWTHWY